MHCSVLPSAVELRVYQPGELVQWLCQSSLQAHLREWRWSLERTRWDSSRRLGSGPRILFVLDHVPKHHSVVHPVDTRLRFRSEGSRLELKSRVYLDLPPKVGKDPPMNARNQRCKSPCEETKEDRLPQVEVLGLSVLEGAYLRKQSSHPSALPAKKCP